LGWARTSPKIEPLTKVNQNPALDLDFSIKNFENFKFSGCAFGAMAHGSELGGHGH